jgi:CubicO group peptidase (beta-lactamase class C family)
VLIARDGHVIYSRAAGWADREGQIPAREDTIFRLASMTKPLVSAATLALWDQGKLNLDDPVTRWLPEFKPKLVDGRVPIITIRELLTHTAGLHYGFLEPETGPYHRLGVSDGLDDRGITLCENLRRIALAPLLYEPGSEWQYSVATDVLGAIVEKITGTDRPSAIRHLVTLPVGMTDTAFVARHAERLAVAYADGKPAPVKMKDLYRLPYGASAFIYSPSRATDPQAFPSGGAGAVGTAGDYLKFLETLRRGGAPILRPETVQLMTRNAIGDLTVSAKGEGWGFGLGFAVLKDPKPTDSPLHVGSYEWGGAYGNSWWVDPQEKVTAVILTNTAIEGMSGRFPEEVKAAVYGK